MSTVSTRLVSIASLVIILAAARAAQEIVLPFLLALFIAIIAAAPASWLQSKKVPGGFAVAIVIVLMIAVLFGTTLILASSIEGFSQAMPTYLDRLRAATTNVLGWLAGIGIDIPQKGITSAFNPGAAMSLVNSFLGSLTSLLSNSFLIGMTVVFVLLEASVFSEKIEYISDDSGRALKRITYFLDDTKHYMAIKALTSLATGVLIAISMMLLGVEYPVLWGFLAFLLNFIPTIGSIIAAVPAILLALVQLGFGSALAVGVIFLTVNMLIGNIIEPRVMGRGVGLSTLVVFLSMVFWGWIFGPIGMLLSIPLTMLVKFASEANETTRWIAILLSSSIRKPATEKKVEAES
ncbi:AI-2E family transporter [Kaarinaea lacus]